MKRLPPALRIPRAVHTLLLLDSAAGTAARRLFHCRLTRELMLCLLQREEQREQASWLPWAKTTTTKRHFEVIRRNPRTTYGPRREVIRHSASTEEQQKQERRHPELGISGPVGPCRTTGPARLPLLSAEKRRETLARAGPREHPSICLLFPPPPPLLLLLLCRC